MDPQIDDKDKDDWWIFISAHGDPDFQNADGDGDPHDILGLIEKVKPIDVHLCKYILTPPEPHAMYMNKSDSINSCLRYCSMFYHNWKAFGMLEQAMTKRNVSVDEIGWVYKMRADFNPEEPWQLPHHPINNMIYVPGSQRNYPGQLPPGWIPDQVGAGNFSSLKHYCSVYPNRENFFLKHGIKIFIPEETLMSHLTVHCISWCKAKCEYSLSKHRFENDDYANGNDATIQRFGKLR
jgi:hypothetical protein